MLKRDDKKSSIGQVRYERGVWHEKEKNDKENSDWHGCSTLSDIDRPIHKLDAIYQSPYSLSWRGNT